MEIRPPFMKIAELLEQVEEIAKAKADGHLTIMRFTTHWKVIIGTPDLTGGDGREEVEQLRPFHCLHDALYDLIDRETRREVIQEIDFAKLSENFPKHPHRGGE